MTNTTTPPTSSLPSGEADQISRRAMALFTPPFKFEYGYIFDAGHNMVADQRDAEGLRVRGWGRIQKMSDAEALQDAAGALIAQALTEFWGRATASPVAAPEAPASAWFAQEFLNWNRSQATPPVAIGKELGVARKVMEIASPAATTASASERIKARFANRPRTPATADFDLPAPNDEIPAQDGAASGMLLGKATTASASGDALDLVQRMRARVELVDKSSGLLLLDAAMMIEHLSRAPAPSREAAPLPKQGEAHALAVAAKFDVQYDGPRGAHRYHGFIENIEGLIERAAALAQQGAAQAATRALDDPKMAAYLRNEPAISAYIETLECEIRKAQAAHAGADTERLDLGELPEPYEVHRDKELFTANQMREHWSAAYSAGAALAVGCKRDERVAKYVPGQWFDARTLDEMQAFYLSRLSPIREAAQQHGYAIGLHGSTRRDFDLMAMQWREDAADKDTLAHAIAIAACGITREGTYAWESKPNGRFAVSLPICWTDHSNPEFGDKPSLGHIDLSIIDPSWMILFIEKRAEDYLRDHAETDEDTGAPIWHYGDAGRDYHSTLVDLADDLRAAMSAATEKDPK